MIMSIIRSSRNPRLPQPQPLSARYNLINKKKQKKKIALSARRVRVRDQARSPGVQRAVGCVSCDPAILRQGACSISLTSHSSTQPFSSMCFISSTLRSWGAIGSPQSAHTSLRTALQATAPFRLIIKSSPNHSTRAHSALRLQRQCHRHLAAPIMCYAHFSVSLSTTLVPPSYHSCAGDPRALTDGMG